MGKTAKIVITVATLLIAGLLIFSQLPMRGYERDLSKIGEGKPAVVLGFENHSPVGIEAMDRISQVREDYEHSALFLVADLMSEEGEEFARRHGTHDGFIALFDAQGNRLDVRQVPEDQTTLRRFLESNLDL